MSHGNKYVAAIDKNVRWICYGLEIARSFDLCRLNTCDLLLPKIIGIQLNIHEISLSPPMVISIPDGYPYSLGTRRVG
jgi:hypothetical protein